VSTLSLSLAILYLFDEWKNLEHKLVACGHRPSHIKSNAVDHICPSWLDPCVSCAIANGRTRMSMDRRRLLES